MVVLPFWLCLVVLVVLFCWLFLVVFDCFVLLVVLVVLVVLSFWLFLVVFGCFGCFGCFVLFVLFWLFCPCWLFSWLLCFCFCCFVLFGCFVERKYGFPWLTRCFFMSPTRETHLFTLKGHLWRCTSISAAAVGSFHFCGFLSMFSPTWLRKVELDFTTGPVFSLSPGGKAHGRVGLDPLSTLGRNGLLPHGFHFSRPTGGEGSGAEGGSSEVQKCLQERQGHRCPFCFFGRKIDGFRWFAWWFNQLPGPSICPKRTPMSRGGCNTLNKT